MSVKITPHSFLKDNSNGTATEQLKVKEPKRSVYDQIMEDDPWGEEYYDTVDNYERRVVRMRRQADGRHVYELDDGDGRRYTMYDDGTIREERYDGYRGQYDNGW